MFNKKGMELPQGVVIVALILIVLVIIILVFVVGGFGTVGQRLKDLFGGQTTGQSIDLAVKTCQNLCDTAKSLEETSRPNSGYCRQTFMVDLDNDPKTALEKVSCGNSKSSNLLRDVANNLGVECSEITRCA